MYAAIELFADRACSVDRRFVLTDQIVPIVAEICRRLDGIPLAIELAAARIPMLHVSALLEKLDQRFALLTSGDRTAFPRQQTMRATIDWSYNLLTPQEQRLFRRLAVFPGGCTLEIAAAVCADPGATELDMLPELSSLVDKSLVIADVDRAQPRYRLLETFRTYAHERLVAHGELEGTARRHASAYLNLSTQLDREWASDRDPAVFAKAQAELENWRAALTWSLGASGDPIVASGLAATLGFVWTNFATSEGRRWMESALRLVDDRTPPQLAARLEKNAAILAFDYNENARGLDLAQRALQRYRDLGDEVRAAKTQCIVGGALITLGRSEGESLLQEALEVAERFEERVLAGEILTGMARARSIVGDYAGARSSFAKAREMFRMVPSTTYYLSWVAGHEAENEFRAGDLGTALHLAADALATHRVRKDYRFLADSLSKVAGYLVALDLFAEARSHAREALLLAREIQNAFCLLTSIQHIAAVLALASAEDEEAKEAVARRAARLAGFAKAGIAALAATQSFSEQRESLRLRKRLPEFFDPAELHALFEEGAAMHQDDAIAEALRP
jgi:hypothetical protein